MPTAQFAAASERVVPGTHSPENEKRLFTEAALALTHLGAQAGAILGHNATMLTRAYDKLSVPCLFRSWAGCLQASTP